MVDFPIFQGDFWKLELIYKENGVAKTITGYKFYLTVKVSNDDTDEDAAIKKEFDPSEAAAGKVIILLTSAEVAELVLSTSTTKYVYDVRMKDASGENQVLMYGELTIKRPTTRITSLS